MVKEGKPGPKSNSSSKKVDVDGGQMGGETNRPGDSNRDKSRERQGI